MVGVGSLVVVGTGIQIGHLTPDARVAIETADRVLYCVADGETESLLESLNARTESLYVYYAGDKRRILTYNQMIDRTLECVRAGERVCAVYYGHPGMFVYPSHQSIKRARAEGFHARMLPAVSSLDCLFADLGIDPISGCQIFEATDLLLRARAIDPGMLVIICQVGFVGDMGFNFRGYDGRNLPTLAAELARTYGSEHEVTIYEAPRYSVCEPSVRKVKLCDLHTAGISGMSTMVVYPALTRPVSSSMLAKLGLEDVVGGKLSESVAPSAPSTP